MTKVRVAYGTIINDIKEVSRSYKEAKMALDVGKIFYANKNVIAYNNLEMCIRDRKMPSWARMSICNTVRASRLMKRSSYRRQIPISAWLRECASW